MIIAVWMTIEWRQLLGRAHYNLVVLLAIFAIFCQYVFLAHIFTHSPAL